MKTVKDALLERIATRQARVGVVGLGYVGLPLLMEFARGGFAVTGFDIHEEKIIKLRRGESYIHHIPAERIRERLANNPVATLTSNASDMGACDAIIICVPTPLTKQREPDMSYVEGTARQLAPYVRRGQLYVLESTTYPGTTDEVMMPVLEAANKLKGGEDFLVAFSPEREDPSNKDYSTSSIPKVVGGYNPDSLAVAVALYGSVIQRTVPVSSTRVAEATKLVENIFRGVNIAMVNELKVIFTEMGIDVWEVINAAKTKPFGYMPFYPGPGLGGHCIPIDPFYLTWKAREYGVATRFIELAGEINSAMPQYVIARLINGLNERRQTVNGSRILLVGLAYKKNVDDVRESPTFVLWEELQKRGASVDYLDPYCPRVPNTREHARFAGIPSRTLADLDTIKYDVALIATAHDNVDHALIASKVGLVIDTRNALPALPNVVKA